METTLVIDTGESIVGVLSVESKTYIRYMGSAISDALDRIRNALEIVTYNGKACDIRDLAKFPNLPEAEMLSLIGGIPTCGASAGAIESGARISWTPISFITQKCRILPILMKVTTNVTST